MDYTNLMNAIYRTLQQGGEDLMNNPKSFTSTLFDLIEGEVPNRKYLYDLFQNGLLKYFASSRFTSSSQVEAAANQAYESITAYNSHLSREWVWSVCEAMAYALESYYSLPVLQMANPDKAVVSPPPVYEPPATPGVYGGGEYPPPDNYPPAYSKPKNNTLIWLILAAAALIALAVVLITRPKTSPEPAPAVTVTVTSSQTPEPTPTETESPTPTPTPTPVIDDGSYLLPQSSTRLLTEADLGHLTHEQLCFARNEIYARHGREFTTKEVAEYFNRQSWYRATIPADQFSESKQLSSIERKNIDFIFAYETKYYGGSYY